MKTEFVTLELITPCFCAGADPSKAEIRAPSIRGQLRWWFRVLGGSRTEEASLFGSVSGDCGRSSSISLRVEDVSKPRFWSPPILSQNSNLGYLLYFASKSSGGARWQNGGALAPGHQFRIHLGYMKPLDHNLAERFSLAWTAFLAFGAIGYRATRGLGTFLTVESGPLIKDTMEKLQRHGFLGGFSEWRGTQVEILPALGAQLRGLRSDFSGTQPGPLGCSSPRQASAVRLRPVRESDDVFRIMVLEAPKEKVLGEPSKRKAPRLNGQIPKPLNPPTRR
jgi:CRISPR-associated protein Cmr1